MAIWRLYELSEEKQHDRIPIRATVLQGGWPLFLHRMGVVLMDKKPFDFKDLIAFGMFILALLTFVFTFCR